MSKVKFIHNRPDDYKIYPVNGVWGGMTPRGDLICHFFVEQQAIPEELVHKLEEDGSLGPPVEEPRKKPIVIRDFQAGILLNREQAISFANWILEKVSGYEKLKEQSEE